MKALDTKLAELANVLSAVSMSEALGKLARTLYCTGVSTEIAGTLTTTLLVYQHVDRIGGLACEKSRTVIREIQIVVA